MISCTLNWSQNTPQLIDTVGELSTTFDFNGAEVYASCGVTFQNKHYIFGGFANKRQIRQVSDCGLISMGTLDFDHYLGACGSTGGAVVLCFNYLYTSEHNRCRQASSPTGPWSEMVSSFQTHKQTAIATSPGLLALVVILKLAET